MINRFVLYAYNPETGRLAASHELAGLTMDEVFEELQLPPDRIIGCEPPPSHETMLKWAERFGFEYNPELSYGIHSTIRNAEPHDTSTHHFEMIDGKWSEVNP